MKDLDQIYAAALDCDPASYQAGNAKFERFVQAATPVAVGEMIDEIRSLRENLAKAESELCNRKMIIEQERNKRIALELDNEQLNTAIRESREHKPVHWRAIISDADKARQTDLRRHIVGFTTLWDAEGWVASERDFGGWSYNIEPLFAAPVPAMPVQDDKIKDALKLAVRFIKDLRVPQNTYEASVQINSALVVLDKATIALNQQ